MKIALVGYGRMGRAVEAQAVLRGHEVVARLGRADLEGDVAARAARLQGADVAVDFTVGPLVADTVRAAVEARCGLVIGTTGLDDEARRAMRDAVGIGIVQGPNFSVGVHLYFRIAREAARLFDALGGYDVHVHEAHHRHKRDHPSGTAWRLADLLVEEIADKVRWQAGAPEEQADPSTLYVTSTRAGEIPGTHVVGFEGPHDGIQLTHQAYGRDAFASGAVRAAEWISGRRGVHTFTEVIDRILDTERTDHGGR